MVRDRHVDALAVEGRPPLHTIVAFILRRGVGLGLMGLGCGTLAAVALNRLLVGLLAEITTLEPAAVGGAAALLFTSIVLACYVPAWRAARLDPLVALRSE